MAKKRKETNEEKQRQSREEVLLARRHEQQTKRVWIAVIAVVALIVVVLLIGIVNELMLKPARPVAMVNGVEIFLGDWRDQVEYRRALLVSRITDIADLVGGDVNQIQQIAGFELQTLSDPEILGQQVLEEMVDNQLILQEAEKRGITVTDAEVQNALEERFLYFDGESPTPQPTPTETLMPTPSLTPISQSPITESVELLTPTSTPISGPTITPLPTPTAVSLESFEESLDGWSERLNDYGIDEGLFRNEVRVDLYRKRLLEALVNDTKVSDEAEQASFFYIRFEDEEEANTILEDIESSGFLSVWNTINSRLDLGDVEDTAIAGELLWRTADNLESILGPEVSQAAFELAIEEPSAVIIVTSQTEAETDAYYIISVSGREERPLTEAAFNNAKQQVFVNWLDTERLRDVITYERWRVNLPLRPLLDTRSWIYPTPIPTVTPGEPLELIATPTPE